MKTYTNTGNKDTRSGFGAGLTELGKTNENVVALCADLIGSLKMDDFKKNHPERFFQVGIAEANMIGLAAGLTIGGKIRTLEDIRLRLESGADKVTINSIAIKNSDFIYQAAKEFGSQCIVVSIDVRMILKNTNENWVVFKNFGKESTGINLNKWSKTVENHGAGEILIQSIDNDGTGEGYDIGMIKTVADTVDIPVIALGGVGAFEHFTIGFFKGKATALAAANIFHFTEHSVLNAKEYLNNNNINVRV